MKAWILVVSICLGIAWGGISSGQGVEDLLRQSDFQNAPRVVQEKGGGTAVTMVSEADRLTHEYHMTQEKNRFYECIVLSVSLMVSLLIVLRFIISTPGYSAVHIVNASALVFIIFGTIFLVILADAEAQLTASMGILGAIAGYLFGTMRRGGEEEKSKVGDVGVKPSERR